MKSYEKSKLCVKCLIKLLRQKYANQHHENMCLLKNLRNFKYKASLQECEPIIYNTYLLFCIYSEPTTNNVILINFQIYVCLCAPTIVTKYTYHTITGFVKFNI